MFDTSNKMHNKIRKYRDIYAMYITEIRKSKGYNKDSIINDICIKFYLSPRQVKHIIRYMLKNENEI